MYGLGVGVLRRQKDGHELQLSAQCILGRSKTCSHPLDDPYTSGEHAKMGWAGDGWELRDLVRRNGTFVDGVRLEPGIPRRLGVGTELGFGEEKGWELVDAGGPTALARNLTTDEVVQAEGELLAIPSDGDPQLSVYPSPSGAGWVMEPTGQEPQPVGHTAEVAVGGATWRLELPMMAESTPVVDATRVIHTITQFFERRGDVLAWCYRFRGEQVLISDLEYAQVVLHLAQARRDDADRPLHLRGWRTVDSIAEDLGLAPSTGNVNIFRSRKALSKAGVEGAAELFEAGPGRRRIGTDRFDLCACAQRPSNRRCRAHAGDHVVHRPPVPELSGKSSRAAGAYRCLSPARGSGARQLRTVAPQV